VPKNDSQVRRLLTNREDIFPDYTIGGFEKAFGNSFIIREKTAVSQSERFLYLMGTR
jgi:hypothetical protein